MSVVTVFGGNGFVGSEYCKTSKSISLKNDKGVLDVHCANVVYFISTVDNYNIHTDSFIDIDTNLVVLMKVLDNYRDYFKHNNERGCFNFISSWFVYGRDSGYGEGSRGIPETDPCDPKGFYSITKRCAEQLLISYCETFNLKYRILRLSNVIGIGDSKVSPKKNAFQYMINEIKHNRPVEVYDSGEFYRDYIDIRDCARAIELVTTEGRTNEIYNIGNGIPCDFGKLLQYAKEISNSTSEIRTIKQKEFHKKVQSSRSFYMDNSKLQALGYRPNHIIYETINDIMKS